MSDLPPGWEWTTLGEIGEWFGGGTPSKSKPEFWTDGTIPWLSPKDMGSEKLGRTRDHITSEAVDRSAVRLVPDDSVAVVVRSGILEHKLPVAQVPFATTLNQDMRSVVTYPGVESAWIAYYLRSAEQEILSECSKRGTTVASIDTSKLMGFRVPLPSTAEQRRIVASLEDHLSRLDAGKQILDKAKVRTKRLDRSIVSSALQGELAEPSAADTPLPTYLNSIAEYRQIRARGEPAKATGTIEVSVPSWWAAVSLATLSRRIQYGTSAKATVNDDGASIPVIRMGNIQGGAITNESMKYLPASHPDISKLLLQDGDILFNRTNSFDLVGKSAVYRDSHGPAVFASYIIRCQLVPAVNPDWISLVINSIFGRRYIEAVASQQVGQANVNGTKLAAMPIPLPPPEEQDRIMYAVRQLADSAERGLISIESARKAAEDVRRSLLAEAFAGKLVPQDPSDEPASVLLERIRNERAATLKTKRGRHKKQETT
ncbi:restriction endonuclease subunit S [Qaidamihabitans albus]|uniref:restriction endonuclease subunit S n=1 Tax=Qaidamihabitans albus TaxID=2795733 RepID=UPI0018F145FB|nr:restriction endonuclease subunit S [Qaidamihabitans albus]